MEEVVKGTETEAFLGANLELDERLIRLQHEEMFLKERESDLRGRDLSLALETLRTAHSVSEFELRRSATKYLQTHFDELNGVEKFGKGGISTEDDQPEVQEVKPKSTVTQHSNGVITVNTQGVPLSNDDKILDGRTYDKLSDYEKRLCSLVKRVQFLVLGEKTTVAFIKMASGFEIVGTSACVNPDDFDKEVGRLYALKDALSQLGEYDAYKRSN